MVPLISILYDEPDPATYRGVQLKMGPEGEPEVFGTGDPTVDYLTAGSVAHIRLGPGASILGTSSVDHFSMDGGDIRDFTREDVEKAIRLARAYLFPDGPPARAP